MCGRQSRRRRSETKGGRRVSSSVDNDSYRSSRPCQAPIIGWRGTAALWPPAAKDRGEARRCRARQQSREHRAARSVVPIPIRIPCYFCSLLRSDSRSLGIGWVQGVCCQRGRRRNSSTKRTMNYFAGDEGFGTASTWTLSGHDSSRAGSPIHPEHATIKRVVERRSFAPRSR